MALKHILLSICVASLLACGEDLDLKNLNLAEYGTPFTIGIGENAATSDSLLLKVLHVKSDSRCAIGATCIWQGEVQVQFEAQVRNTMYPLELKLSPGQTDIASASFENYELELLEVNPYPDLGKHNGTIRHEDYLLTLVLRQK